MKSCSLVVELHFPQNFCPHRQTYRHFPKILKWYSGHPKTCKSIKNRKSKISKNPIFLSIYREESNNFENEDISARISFHYFRRIKIFNKNIDDLSCRDKNSLLYFMVYFSNFLMAQSAF